MGSDPNYWDNTYDKFNGTIDEVIIYNRALSAQEILDCYKSGKEHFVTGSSDSKEIISYEWDFESDGIYDYQETPNNAPDGTFDRKTTYIYGDNGIYTVTLRVTDETNATDTDTCNITVNNVDPIVQPTGDLTVDENSPFTLTIQTADIGSDDLTLTWNFGYGTPEITNTFYNDGTGPDPYPSPWGTFPFYTTDTQSHTYGDDGVFNVTLTVTDDDRGSIVYTIKVTVQNVDPTATIISTLMDVEIGIRVAGRKYNNVSMTLFEDGIQIGYVSIERQPGSPDEQMAWIPWVLDMTKTYSAIVTYEPEDPPNVGGNPVWIYIKLENGSIRKIHHTFNIQQSKNRDSDHWNHVDPWEVDLNVNLFGCPFEVTSHVTDPGSDDETLTFTYGSQTVSVTHLNNPPNPDPYPSPEISPVDITDTTALNYEGPGTIYLTVVDDDGGTDIATLDIT
ncbi:MAG: PKD domain-containing protein [Thermoplasmata archaeon]|nr:MAG: PKD domain-containing protein [Thermoplasmata archaeon]